MATIKKTTFINTELEWAETQLISWKAYVDANPLHELKDRIEWKPTAKGGMLPMVIASIEAQGKFVQETMKNYLALVEVVDKSFKSSSDSLSKLVKSISSSSVISLKFSNPSGDM